MDFLYAFCRHCVANPRAIFAVTEAANGDPPSTKNPAAQTHLPADGNEWVDLFVREMASSSNMDDARARVSRTLEALEKTIRAQAGAEAAKSFHQVSFFSLHAFPFYLFVRLIWERNYLW